MHLLKNMLFEGAFSNSLFLVLYWPVWVTFWKHAETAWMQHHTKEVTDAIVEMHVSEDSLR